MHPVLDADGDRNGIVDAGDYHIWKSYFGTSGAAEGRSLASSSLAQVPEPATMLALIAICSAAIGSRLCSNQRPTF
jgi:hypothetical protein